MTASQDRIDRALANTPAGLRVAYQTLIAQGKIRVEVDAKGRLKFVAVTEVNSKG